MAEYKSRYMRNKYGQQDQTPAAASDSTKQYKSKYMQQKHGQKSSNELYAERLQEMPQQPKTNKTTARAALDLDPAQRQQRGSMVSSGAFLADGALRQKYGTYDNYLNDIRVDFDSAGEAEMQKSRMEAGMAQQRMQQAQTQLEQTQQEEKQLQSVEARLMAGQSELNRLYAVYQQTGSVTDGEAYLAAADAWEKSRQAYNARVKSVSDRLQKSQDGYMKSVQAALSAQQKQSKAQDNYQKQQEQRNSPAYREAELERLNKQIEELEAGRMWNGEYLNPESKVQADQLKAKRDALQVRQNEYVRSGQKVQDDYAYVLREKDYDRYSNMRPRTGAGTDNSDQLGIYLNMDEAQRQKARAEFSENPDHYTESVIIGDAQGWDQMTEDEIGIYYYLGNKEGRQAAEDYLDKLQPVLNRRATEKRKTQVEQMNWFERIAANAASIPANLAGGAAATADNIKNLLTGREINPYGPAYDLLNYAQDVRGSTAQRLDKNAKEDAFFTWGDAYQAMMSGLDSLAGGFVLGPVGYATVMSSGAAASKAKELYDRGATSGQIAASAIVSAAAEYIFEKYSIEKLFDVGNAKSRKQLIGNVLKQGVFEFSEEVNTEIVDIISDVVVMRSQSQWKQNIDKYLDAGATMQQATTMAFMDALKQVGAAGLSGLISGVGSGSVVAVASGEAAYTKQREQVAKEVGKTIAEAEGVQELVQEGLAAAPESEAHKQAEILQNKLDSGKQISEREIGEQVFANEQAMQAGQLQNEAEQATENTGLSWAGAEQTDGGIENGEISEQAEQRAAEQPEDVQREPGAGEYTGRPDQRTDGRSGKNYRKQYAQAAIRRSEEAGRVQRAGAVYGGAYRSLRELGLSVGSQEQFVYELPEEGWTEEIREAREIAEAEGLRLVPIVGNMHAMTASGERTISAAVENGVVYARADSIRMSLHEAVLHEAFHKHAEADPKLVPKLIKQIKDTYSERELTALIAQYYDTYEGVYEAASEEDLEEKIWTEMLADAYAEYQRYRDFSADEYAAEVQEAVWNTRKGEGAGETETKYSIAGVNARTADFNQLQKARQMQRNGESPGKIFFETGWYEGMDGQWRFEIDDSEMVYSSRGDLNFRKEHPGYDRYRELIDKKNRYMLELSDIPLTEKEETELNGLREQWKDTFRIPGKENPDDYYTSGKLSDYVQHEELYRAYPELRYASLRFEDLGENAYGRYDRQDNTIILNEKIRSAPQDTIIHEIQHAIQASERFEGGSSPRYWEKRKKEGFSLRQNERRIAAADKEYNRIFRSAPEEFQNKIREMNRARLNKEYDRAEQIVDELYDSEYADLFTELDMADFVRRGDPGGELSAGELYENTAGEIEARDSAKRRTLTASERRQKLPDLGGENVVFAGKSAVGWFLEKENDETSIKQQLHNSADILNQMDVVGSVTVPTYFKKKDQAAKWAIDILKPTGYKVDRLGYGTISFSEKDIDTGLRYADKPEEKAAIILLPKVLKRGIEIGRHGNHKKRAKQTITFAAPVSMNGQRGNMAVVVNQHGNTYYAHRIVLPDGREFRFSDNIENAAQELSRGVTENGSLAKTTSAASENIVGVSEGEVNTFFSVEGENRGRQRAERKLASGIAEIMSIPKSAERQLREGPVRAIMETYQETGEIDREALDEALDEAFAQGMIIDSEYFERYKPVKDYLRKQAVTISETDRQWIPDWTQFRKRAFGTLTISNNGLPVDSAYMEVREMAPELFPEDITNPADQLVKMFEVARSIRMVETPLERALGDDSEAFFAWARQRMEKLVERVLTEYADTVDYKPERTKKPEEKPVRFQEPISYERKLGDYDRANEQMHRYGQSVMEDVIPRADYRPVEEDNYDRENERLPWAGQERMPEYREQKQHEMRLGEYDRSNERMPEFGQSVMEGYRLPPKQTEETENLSEMEKARRGSLRDWINYVASGKMTAEEFASALRMEPRPAAPIVQKMMDRWASKKDIAAQLKKEEMSEKEYQTFLNHYELQKQKREEDARRAVESGEIPKQDDYLTPVQQLIIQKDRFTSTPAMEKLGIKIDGSVTRYRATDMLRSYDKAARKTTRIMNERIRKLKASETEMQLAKLLVSGGVTVDMLNQDKVNIETILELADYTMAVDSFKEDLVRMRRDEINSANLRIAEELFKGAGEKYDPKLKGKLAAFTKLVMNERTPERVVKQIFGATQGEKIYETYFRPVWVNGAEMSRFENRMLKRVETFTDKDGKQRKLTELEREFAQRLMEGEAAKEAVEKLNADNRQRVTAVAENLNNGAAFLDEIREWGIENEEYLQGVAQAYADYLSTVSMSKDMDQTILKNAIAEYRKIYNEMYDAINDFLVSHGYNEIGFIRGYAPHFQKREVQQGLFGALKALGVEKESVSELPASIAGRTADFKPNMKWNPHTKERKGKSTSFDIQQGFEQYLHYAAEMFYHTDDVMRVRQAVQWFRKEFSGEEISSAIEDAQVDRVKSVDWKRDFLIRKNRIKATAQMDNRGIDEVYDAYLEELYQRAQPESLQKFSEFVTWLDNYANIVAGKQSMADRGIEYEGGRKALNAGSWLMRAFSSANVAGNISSVLNQSAQLPLIQQQLGRYMERAIADIARGVPAKENFAERSDFLTDKHGVDKLTENGYEKFISTLFKPAQMMDNLVSQIAVRGRYLQALDEGMTPEQALREADDFGRRVMGSRMKGAKPLAFESKKFINQMLHVFQVEASNTFDYMMLSDMPQAVRNVVNTKGKKAGAKYAAAAGVAYLLNAFLLNRLTDELYGGSPAPFDLLGWLLNFVAGGWSRSDSEFIKTLADNVAEKLTGERLFETEELDLEEGFDWAGAMDDLGYNVLGDVPYVRNAMGVLGVGDQSLPTVGINDFGEDVWNVFSTLGQQLFQGEEETGLTWAGAIGKAAEHLGNAVLQIAPGGRQLSKTYQGVKSMIEGGKTSGYGENKRLLYPVERTPWNVARAGLFGLSALDESDAYYAGGQGLTAEQTQKMKKLEQAGVDRFVTYGLYEAFRDINKDMTNGRIASWEAKNQKRDAIDREDLTDEQKLDAYMELIVGNSRTAENTRAKYQKLLDAGVSWSQISGLENAYAQLGADEDMDGTADLSSLERGIAKRNEIASMTLTDWQKFQVFDEYHLDPESKNYEKIRDEYMAMMDSGLSWDDITAAHNTWAELDADEEMNASQKATAYAQWADQRDWNSEQINAVKNRYKFWQMLPAQASTYEKYTGAGLDSDKAMKVTELLAGLEPEPGKETVSTNQKIKAIESSGLNREDRTNAIAALVTDRVTVLTDAGVNDQRAKEIAVAIAIAEAENGDEDLWYIEKARTAVDLAGDDTEAMAALSTIVADSTYEKMELANEYGATARSWVAYREEYAAMYGDANVSQERVERVLDGMNIGNAERAALWQIANKSWKPGNNPYDTGIGREIYEELN